ncbi:hypothetical protein EVAR_75670_1 [Eumeta japonica]|uniref:Uncharacterized protein n=1 Tax=Eumeta variegata TaxID=151549 RepID=A0A4C1U0H8_EUMVA|nr:hypothetical protein EVAR_75670_1 [Eumeta japonica]
MNEFMRKCQNYDKEISVGNFRDCFFLLLRVRIDFDFLIKFRSAGVASARGGAGRGAIASITISIKKGFFSRGVHGYNFPAGTRVTFQVSPFMRRGGGARKKLGAPRGRRRRGPVTRAGNVQLMNNVFRLIVFWICYYINEINRVGRAAAPLLLCLLSAPAVPRIRPFASARRLVPG